MPVAQKTASFWEASATLKIVSFVGTLRVCGDRHPLAAYADETRKSVHIRNGGLFL